MTEHRPDRPVPPRPDPDQADVVAHRGRVLQVVGGPGTGKTTTAVEVVLDRVRRDGLAPDHCLLLAPTRLAAAQLRADVTARLGGTSTEPLARTPSATAFALLRQAATLAGDPLPRLLSGAEQDLVLADLLSGHREGSRPGPQWPASVHGALGTRGFRAQLRDLLMRAVEHGVEPDRLAELGRQHDRPEWVAAAAVLREYDEVTALRSPGAYDPAWICTAAADLLADDEAARGRAHDRLRLIVVDDAHELTASAARLVHALRGPEADVVLLGDGDLTVHAFRGADPARFGRLAELLAAGSPTRLVLRTGHRLPAGIAETAGRVTARIGASSGVDHRRAAPRAGAGRCEVRTLRTSAQEVAYVAGRLRRAHLLDGVPWSRMAVVARSRRRHDALRRALAGAGVPVVVPGSALPLAREPAVRMLLLAYQASLRGTDAGHPSCTAAEAVDLLSSPLGGADPVSLLRLRRSARAAERADGGAREPDEVLAGWLDHPAEVAAAGADAVPVRRVARVLAAGRAAAARDGHEQRPAAVDAEAVLWAVWQATGLAGGWSEEALRGGAPGARADRDLDAVMLLFGAAADYVDRLPGRGPDGFAEHVAALEVGADSLVARAAPAEAVAVLTPQAAAGAEWDRVVVVGVQEGVWPDLRLRDSLLGADALVGVLHGRPVAGPAGVRAAQAQVRADELRQLYVALTRAREQVLVTAVSGTDEQPSAFLDVIDPREDDRQPVEVPPALTLRGVVAELRRQLVRAHRVGDRAARDVAAARLARLAGEGVPGAHPGRWWDALELSDSRPLVEQEPVTVSPSQVQAVHECALRWLLASRGGAGEGPPAAAVGTLVHDIVATWPESDLPQLTAQLEARWPELGLGTGWAAERERRRAGDMLRRYVGYVDAATAEGRRLVGTEIDVSVPVGGAVVTGRVDRLETDPRGRLRVVDLKTGASKPGRREIDRHPQLGVYQVAVVEGGLVRPDAPGSTAAGGPPAGDPPEGGPPRTAGAALVHLGRAAGARPAVQVQPPLAEDPEPRWAHQLVDRAAERMSGAAFPATAGPWCRSCPVTYSCPLQPEGRTTA